MWAQPEILTWQSLSASRRALRVLIKKSRGPSMIFSVDAFETNDKSDMGL